MSDARVLLWDFGDTLADERWAWSAPAGVRGWSAAYRRIGDSELGERWNLGDASTRDVAQHLATELGLEAGDIHQHLERTCASIAFFPTSWRVACRHALPQAVVTVNPLVFRQVIVPTYELDQVFDVIVVSAEEHTTDKVRLCELALERLGKRASRHSSLLIDNISDNVERWRASGGLGYQFLDDATFAQDLTSGRLPIAFAIVRE